MALKTFKGILGVHDDISELRYVEDSKKYLDCLTLRYFYPGCITCNCGIVKKDVDTFIEKYAKPFKYDDTDFQIVNHCLHYIGKGGRVSIPEGLYSMNGMFQGCTLDTLILDFDTSKILNMGSMFENAKIGKLELGSNFTTCNVHSMTKMFKDAKIADMHMFSGFNTINVKNMDNMFENCVIPSGFIVGSNFDITNVWQFYGCFYNCKFPEGFTLKEIYTTKDTDMISRHAFSKTVLPEGFEFGNDRSKAIGLSDSTFKDCVISDGFCAESIYTSKERLTSSCFNGCILAPDFIFPEGFDITDCDPGLDYSKVLYGHKEYKIANEDLDTLLSVKNKKQNRKLKLEKQCKKELLKLLKEGKTISEARQSLVSSCIDLSGYSQHDFEELLDSAVIFISEALASNCNTDASNLLSFKSNDKYSKYTIGEVRDKLLAKGYPKEIVYECILNYISDQYLTL